MCESKFAAKYEYVNRRLIDSHIYAHTHIRVRARPHERIPYEMINNNCAFNFDSCSYNAENIVAVYLLLSLGIYLLFLFSFSPSLSHAVISNHLHDVNYKMYNANAMPL